MLANQTIPKLNKMAGKIYQAIFISIITLIISCDSLEPEVETIEHEKVIPQETFIRVPSSLNEPTYFSNLKNIKGDIIYNYIRQYIGYADFTAEFIEKAYERIYTIERGGIFEFSYTGLDGKTKHINIHENYVDSVSSWDYYMEIYNETFADLALRTWWNTAPFEQIIYFKPSSLNSDKMKEHPDALVEINYKTGDAAGPYEKSMFVALTGLTTPPEIPFDPDNIMISIGQYGNTLDIRGASNNPDVTLLNHHFRGGRNWSFVAKVNTAENIAAVKLALPPSEVETSENLFTDYLLKKVLLDEILELYPGSTNLSEDELLNLVNIDGSKIQSPAFFNQSGFVSSGDAPSASYSGLTDFEGLTPYIPTFVRDYEIKLEVDEK